MAASALQPLGAGELEVLTSLFLVGLMLAAVHADFRRGRIPNRLTLGAAAAGLLLNLMSGGLGGAAASVGGWLLGAGLFFAFFALGAMGAGDVKLLAAVGALEGPSFVFNAFVFTGLAGGLMAVLVLVQRRRVGYALASARQQFGSLVSTGGLTRLGDGKSSPLRFPYGLAIAVGSVAALFWRV